MTDAAASPSPQLEPPRGSPLRAVAPPAPEQDDNCTWIAPATLADLVTAPATGVAEVARAGLLPLLPHDALVIVTPASAGAPVQIAARPGVRASLTEIEWSRILGDAGEASEGTVVRIALQDVVDGLSTAAWSATTGGCAVWLVIAAQAPLELDRAKEAVAEQIAMLTAARARRIDGDPPPATLAFSRAMSLERERVRAQLSTSYAATLSGLLHTLRSANNGGSRTAPPEVSAAINLASRALLDLETHSERHDPFSRVVLSKAFAAAEDEVGRVVHAARIRVLGDLDAPDGAHVPQAIAQAARFVSRAAALNATRHEGAEKLRLLWRLTGATLAVTIADDGAGSDDTNEERAKLADVYQRVAGLGADIELDSNPQWGTNVICRLPLNDVSATPETPGARRLEQLRDREREVLELMIAGMRNRDIAERLCITVRTVKYHVSNILQTLGVASRTEAIALAHSAGISPPTPDPEPASAVAVGRPA